MPIRTRVGDTFVIELEANPTTGYVWQPELAGNAREVNHELIVPSADAVGAASHEIFTFEALTAGRFTIRMLLQRPWESHPLRVETFEIDARG